MLPACAKGSCFRFGIRWEPILLLIFCAFLNQSQTSLWFPRTRETSENTAATAGALSERPNDRFAIVQFDSRKFMKRTYWYAAARWNAEYARRHGHRYILYSQKTNNTCKYGNETLAEPWCKVRAMLKAHQDFPSVDFFLYMDSDAMISHQFADRPMNELVANISAKLSWNASQQPVLFNQDGPSWWCRLVNATKQYETCLNAGTVGWYRSSRALQVLQKWWDSSMDSYQDNPLGFEFRAQWPWEQDRQMSLLHANDTISSYVQVTPHPDQPHMDIDADWCLSHLAEANCFVSHYCADPNSKEVMRKKIVRLLSGSGIRSGDFTIYTL